ISTMMAPPAPTSLLWNSCHCSSLNGSTGACPSCGWEVPCSACGSLMTLFPPLRVLSIYPALPLLGKGRLAPRTRLARAAPAHGRPAFPVCRQSGQLESFGGLPTSFLKKFARRTDTDSKANPIHHTSMASVPRGRVDRSHGRGTLPCPRDGWP